MLRRQLVASLAKPPEGPSARVLDHKGLPRKKGGADWLHRPERYFGLVLFHHQGKHQVFASDLTNARI
jgi:hypothetical protein